MSEASMSAAIDEAVAPEDISSQSAEPSAGGRASEEVKQGEASGASGASGASAAIEVEVVASAPKRKRAPTATPRKKKKDVLVEVEPATPRHSVDITDPLFFPRLNVVHRKMQQDARRSKLSSLPIV